MRLCRLPLPLETWPPQLVSTITRGLLRSMLVRWAVQMHAGMLTVPAAYRLHAFCFDCQLCTDLYEFRVGWRSVSMTWCRCSCAVFSYTASPWSPVHSSRVASMFLAAAAEVPESRSSQEGFIEIFSMQCAKVCGMVPPP